MLKLKRKQSSRDIQIILPDKKPLCSINFGKAFLIAFFIHLLGFILFQVTPIKPFISESIPSISYVALEVTPSQLTQVIVNTESDTVKSAYISSPKQKLPTIPEITETLNFNINENDLFFSQINDDIYPLTFDLNPLEKLQKPLTIAQLTVHTSGLLSNLTSPTVKTNLIDVYPDQIEKISYEVRVHAPTGKIIWHNLHENFASENFTLQAEVLLQEMQFDTVQDQFVLEGFIEIIGVS